MDSNTNYAVNALYKIYPQFSSKNFAYNKINFVIVLFLIITSISLIINTHITLTAILFLSNLIWLVSILFKITLTLIGLFMLKSNKSEFVTDDKILPLYSILVPVYKESKIIKYLIKNLSMIDYPKEKLEILILVEEDDDETITALKNEILPFNFKIINIPISYPRTKPKACNYGLLFANGDYVTIYDAEDMPDNLQLRKVIHKFNQLGEEYICVQAQLNYYNKFENFLTKSFAIEYSHWFELMLPALHKLNMIIPLGGTSNHFKKNKLVEINLWDPHNLTEDAELGIRLSLLGYKTALVQSITLEESPINLKNWITQRTRWIKGYIQTYVTSFKNIHAKNNGLTIFQKIGFHLFIGLPSFTYILNPLIWLINLMGLLEIGIDFQKTPEFVIVFSKYIFISGVCLLFIISIIVIIKNKWFNMIQMIVFFPFYWILHCIATYRAFIQIYHNNFLWEKTNHGVSKIFKKGH